MTDEWRDIAMWHERDAAKLRERLVLMRIDPDTLAVDFEARPISRERIERGRTALRVELVALADARAAGTDAKSGEHVLAVADAILAALGEDGIDIPALVATE